MKKTLMILVACLLLVAIIGTPAFAEISVNTDGLTDAQKADLIKQAESYKSQNNNGKSVIPISADEASKWVDLGRNIGAALANAAKEIGVAADQFLMSTTGKITMALIIWKIMGNELTHLIVGITLFLCLFIPWLRYFRKICVIKNVEYTAGEKAFRRTKKIEYYKQGECTGTRLTMVAILALIIITTISIIFTA